jgi:Flp pilus assembly protein protease CpaA
VGGVGLSHPLAAGAAAVVDLHEHRIPNRLLSLSLVLVAVAEEQRDKPHRDVQREA